MRDNCQVNGIGRVCEPGQLLHCFRAPARIPFHRDGSALLLVLWAIALLSFLVITALMVAMQGSETIGSRNAAFRARQLAEMGIAVASNSKVKKGDPLLRWKISATERYEATITSEEARMNLQALLTEERRPVLERVFTTWGMTRPDAAALVDKLMDWVDEDGFKRLNGAESDFYRGAGFPDRPSNREFQSLDEVSTVFGIEALEKVRPDWRDWFTLRGSGKLDVNEASAPMLALAVGAPLPAAEMLVHARDGADGVPGTEDDAPIKSVGEACALLGVGAKDGDLLDVESHTLSVRSVGVTGGCARGISCVIGNKAGKGTLAEWREFNVELR